MNKKNRKDFGNWNGKIFILVLSLNTNGEKETYTSYFVYYIFFVWYEYMFLYDTLLGVMYNLLEGRHPPGQKELSMGCIYYTYTHNHTSTGIRTTIQEILAVLL